MRVVADTALDNIEDCEFCMKAIDIFFVTFRSLVFSSQVSQLISDARFFELASELLP